MHGIIVGPAPKRHSAYALRTRPACHQRLIVAKKPLSCARQHLRPHKMQRPRHRPLPRRLITKGIRRTLPPARNLSRTAPNTVRNHQSSSTATSQSHKSARRFLRPSGPASPNYPCDKEDPSSPLSEPHSPLSMSCVRPHHGDPQQAQSSPAHCKTGIDWQTPACQASIQTLQNKPRIL
jgi:hypothetical protein